MNKNTEGCSTNEEFLVASSSDSVHKLGHMLYMYVYGLPKVSFITAVVYFFVHKLTPRSFLRSSMVILTILVVVVVVVIVTVVVVVE